MIFQGFYQRRQPEGIFFVIDDPCRRTIRLRMLEMKMDLETITKATGLPPQKIKKLLLMNAGMQ